MVVTHVLSNRDYFLLLIKIKDVISQGNHPCSVKTVEDTLKHQMKQGLVSYSRSKGG